ncbi:MAG: AAA family ATPase [Coprococcus sp.]
MSRRVSIGYQEFADIISNDLFYVDKTLFIKEWWERRDYVTLITRPRRFKDTDNE